MRGGAPLQTAHSPGCDPATHCHIIVSERKMSAAVECQLQCVLLAKCVLLAMRAGHEKQAATAHTPRRTVLR